MSGSTPRTTADPPGALAARRRPELRSKIMPVNDRYPLDDVLAACRRYDERNRRRSTSST